MQGTIAHFVPLREQTKFIATSPALSLAYPLRRPFNTFQYQMDEMDRENLRDTL